MSYRKRTLDLTLVKSNPVELVPVGKRVTEVFITKMPAGVTIQLLFGQNSDPIDIDSPVSFEPSKENGNFGLYWQNPTALPGTLVDVYVVTGDDDSQLDARPEK